jgi:hypothetical protein
MEHYVTLFDSFFLPQGLSLHRSMTRHLGEFALWVLCVDDAAFEALVKLALPNVRLLQLSRLETAELKSVKLARTKGEYCWTLTPFTPRFVFEADPSVARVTYLDADLSFQQHPRAIFSEFEASGKQVLITDHAYAPENDKSRLSGQYCVQFMTFTRKGEAVRQWWEERCLEWCYDRHEDGKFGDQKYLDTWPVMFAPLVHVLANQSLLLAPWNATRFPCSSAVIWHFHGARAIVRNGRLRGVWAGNYPLPRPTIEAVYRPYFRDMRAAVEQLAAVTPRIASQSAPGPLIRAALLLRACWRQLWKLRAGRMIVS